MSSGPPTVIPSHRLRVLWWSTLALALVVRLLLWTHRSGPLWFEEDVPVVWAWQLWGFAGHGFDLNPHNALWPHLSVYVFFAVQALQYAFGLARGAWSGPADWNAAMTASPDSLRAAAMLAAIAIGMCVLVASARLARRVAGEAAAVGVAVVFALDPLFLRHSLIVSPDMLLTLFVVLGLHASLDVIERGRVRDSLLAGLWLGLGTACKYSPLLLAVPITLAHAYRPGGRRGLAVARDGRLWLAAATSLAAFVLTTPFTVLDLFQRWREFALGAAMLGPGPTGNAATYAGREFFASTLPGDLGWPLYALLAAAAAWALARRTPARLVLLAFLAVYLAAFATVPTAFPRYLMPAYPPALALGAAALAALVRTRPAHARLRGATIALAATALAGLIVCSVQFGRTYLRPDSRTLAREWFVTHVPAGAVIATEHAGPVLPDRIARAAAGANPAVSGRWRVALGEGPAYCVGFLPMSFPDPEISSSMYALPDYTDFDYVVTSTGVSGRYLAQPARFPEQGAFYDGLARFAVPVYRTPEGDCSGPGITVYRTSNLPRAQVSAWWAARLPHPAGFRNPRDAAHGAVLWRDRAQFFSRALRERAAVRAWRRALAWRWAPGAWRQEFARTLASAR